MYEERRSTQRYAFVAGAEVADSVCVRNASVGDLSIHGCYLAMPDPFSKGASVLVKIRTNREFFQCRATVAHSTPGVGMGLEFHIVSPPFQIVLQEWLLHTLQYTEIRK
jgi:PilZ domain